MYYITVYHINDSGRIRKYHGSTDSYDRNSKKLVDPAWALSTFWKYEHYMSGDGWDWVMTPEEFNKKFADGVHILYMDLIPNCGFSGTSLVEIQVDRTQYVPK